MPVACRSCPGVRARRARRAAASVAPAVPAVTAAPAAPVAPAPHTGIPTRRVSRRDPPTSRFRRGPPERLLVDSGIQKCHGCVGDPRLTPKMRGSTHVPRADGDPQLSIGDPGTTFHPSLPVSPGHHSALAHSVDEMLHSEDVIEGYLAMPPSDRAIFEDRLNSRQQREFFRAVFQYRNRNCA